MKNEETAERIIVHVSKIARQIKPVGKWGQRLDAAISAAQEAKAAGKSKPLSKAKREAHEVIDEIEATSDIILEFQIRGPWAQAQMIWIMKPRWDALRALGVVDDVSFAYYAAHQLGVASEDMPRHLERAWRRVIADPQSKWVASLDPQQRLDTPWGAWHQLNVEDYKNLDCYVCEDQNCDGRVDEPEVAEQGCPDCGGQMVPEYWYLRYALETGGVPWEEKTDDFVRAVKKAKSTTPEEAAVLSDRYLKKGKARPQTAPYIFFAGDTIFKSIPPTHIKDAWYCRRCGEVQDWHNPETCALCGGELILKSDVRVEKPLARVTDPDDPDVEDWLTMLEAKTGLRRRD